MKSLADLHCKIHKKGDPLLTNGEIQELRAEIPQWELIESDSEMQIIRKYPFSNFLQALKFTNQIGALAEKEDHHPSITTEWGLVTVCWWTHTIHGLHKNDFIMAAKTDRLYTLAQKEAE